MSRLRVVADGDGGEPVAFDVACRNALDAALASGAIAVVILYETQHTIGWASVPPSDALCRGMVATVADMIEPGGRRIKDAGFSPAAVMRTAYADRSARLRRLPLRVGNAGLKHSMRAT